MISTLTNRAINDGLPATVEEALQLNSQYSTAELCKAADIIRLKWCGNKIHTCSIVNARSGRCSENCKWCAQSGCHKTGVQEYERIPKNEALKAYAVNKTRGASCFSMVTSGRNVLSKDIEYFCGIYKEMSEQGAISEDEIERSVALMRFIAPKCTLHFAGGRARLSRPATARILRGGMNGALVGDMLTTVGNNVEDDFKLFKSVDYEK